MPTPGLLYAQCKVKDPSTFPITTFNSWYDETHIPDMLSIPLPNGPCQARRYTAETANPPFEYLAVYPMDDVDWIHNAASKVQQGEAEMSLKHPGLGGGDIFDIVDFEGRDYGLLEGGLDSLVEGRRPWLVSVEVGAEHGLGIKEKLGERDAAGAGRYARYELLRVPTAFVGGEEYAGDKRPPNELFILEVDREEALSRSFGDSLGKVGVDEKQVVVWKPIGS